MTPKTRVLTIFLFIGCAVVLTTGCRKLYDYISNHGDGDYKACNIKKITAYRYSPSDTLRKDVDTITYTFTYNRLGDPVSITNDHVQTANPNFLFSYDKYNRLISMVQPYTGAVNYELWHKYGYNDKGQIVKDTNYFFGAIVGGVPQPSVHYGYITYQYDAKGRIIHEVDSIYISGMFANISSSNYAYDANGNLVTGAVYDNKLNLNRTNSVWMFIRRDYSVNNPFTALQYNENGLPLSVFGQIKLLPFAAPDIHIEYFCH